MRKQRQKSLQRFKQENPPLFALMMHNNESSNDSLDQENNACSSSADIENNHRQHPVINDANSTPVTPRDQTVSNESSSVVTTPDLYEVRTRLMSNRDRLVRTRLNLGS